MALNITQEQYNTIEAYANAGDYVSGWNYLASIGDNYADNAYAVTSGSATGMMNQPATQLTAPVATILLTLMLFVASPGWAKGPLDGESSAFSKQVLSPILIREKLCSSVQDCREHEYFFSTSWDSISYDLYGITDGKLIKEIFLAMLNSGLRVSHFRVWRSKRDDKSFFEKPILELTDHTGGK